MDEYFVRLGRAHRRLSRDPDHRGVGLPAGRTVAEIRSLASSEPPPVGRRLQTRTLVKLAILATVALAALAHRDAVSRWASQALDVADEPVEQLRGETQLRQATTALERLWREEGTYDVTLDRLRELDPSVDWGDTVELRPCFDGRAAVVVAESLRGNISRLLVEGDDEGDVMGARECPESLTHPEPWGRG